MKTLICALLFGVLILACTDNTPTVDNTPVANVQTPKPDHISHVPESVSEEKQPDVIPARDVVDDNFHAFVHKFSTDSLFQVSRTKFPLKVVWYGYADQADTTFYIDRSTFEMTDFRQQKSTGEVDQWEQQIVFDKHNQSATIGMRGIDNGIFIDYLFKKIHGVWMFIGIEDRST